MWHQQEIHLPEMPRGFHLITDEIARALPCLAECHQGLLHLQLMHTSASLTLNENTDPDVRHDLDAFIRRLVPEGLSYFQHTLEGPDDMPAHLKTSILGSSVQIPITDGSINLGTWQGIYLFEHRTRAHQRQIAAHFLPDS